SRSRSRARMTCVVERLVVNAAVQLGFPAPRGEEPLGPEEHDYQDDQAVDPRRELRHVESLCRLAGKLHVPDEVNVRVEPGAGVTEARVIEVRKERAADDHAPDVAHPAEDDHAEDKDRDLEEEVAGKSVALERRVVRAGDPAEE